MKAKTMLGLIACASACVSLSAFGNETNDWFDVTVVSGDIVPNHCSTNGAAVTIEGSAIKLEDASLGINNFAAAPTSDGIVKISATALLTPSSTNDFADVSDQSKAGFAVGIDDQDKTNFYGYANGVWHKLLGTPGDGETTFSMIINYRDTNVCFYVGNDLLDDGVTSIFNLASDANGLNGISASGSGYITSVTGAYEVAVAAYGDKKYGSIAEASSAVKAASAADPTATVQVVNADGSTEDANAVAANGLRKIVCEALGLPMNDSTANIAVAPVATDDDSGNITLELTLSNVTEPDAVGFVVSGSDTKYDADGIKIPLTAGTYTITPVLK
jgi:hypothetical protein